MRAVNEARMPEHVEADTSDAQGIHDLLNEATMWLQYSRGVTATLADLIHEADEVDCQQLALSLEAIAAMTRLGVHQLSEARAQAYWGAASEVPDRT
ncbi:hypothetical protein [Luteibacter aegosomatissinici]|uniref:hypothetical protein n=1 Tax=Luteibacter aegosomatissinici TaxID=2911539 RepID=UPI001FFA01D7|nr:hypothetical protein [Luteibacter aegosomatissinici]UPG92640.1 hypothetical protein L2Y97_12255 [Luteibacter aegosomatissinici]